MYVVWGSWSRSTAQSRSFFQSSNAIHDCEATTRNWTLALKPTRHVLHGRRRELRCRRADEQLTSIVSAVKPAKRPPTAALAWRVE